jgi:hypothetical protein
VKAESYQIKIYDPNTKQTENYQKMIKKSKSKAAFNFVTISHLKKLNKQDAIELSLKTGVMCSYTAFVAYERIADINQDPLFVQIPLNTTNST